MERIQKRVLLFKNQAAQDIETQQTIMQLVSQPQTMDLIEILRFIGFTTVTGMTVTVTTSLPHDLDVNEKVNIVKVKSSTNTTGIGNSGYNGTFIVDSIPTSKTFTYDTTDVDGIVHNVGTFTAGQLSTRDINLPRFERNDLLSNYYIYRNDTIKPYISGQQDGIYHLFVLNASNPVPEEFTESNYSQNVVDLYPQLDRDNLNDNPPAAISFAKRSPLGDVATNSLKNSLTRETNDKLLKNFGVGFRSIQLEQTQVNLNLHLIEHTTLVVLQRELSQV